MGSNIVCFAKDWTEDPTSNNHVMSWLAHEGHVLWLNSIGSRRPNFGDKRDLLKIVKKLERFAQGPKERKPNLNVYTPIVLPFPHSELAGQLNSVILKITIAVLRKRLGLEPFDLWSFLPTAEQYVGTLGEELSVYYCTDEWSAFSYIDTEKVIEQERRLCEKADIVFATSHSLVERKKRYNPETYLASHGVSYAHFSQALSDETRVHPEIADLPKPILGFFGLIQDWIDIELFAYLAKQRPDWSIVVIGKSMVDDSELRKYPNIRLIPRRPFEELPQFCKGFDLGLCPFRINELTRHVNPIKLREYLCAGLPVVSTDLPECRYYGDSCGIARSHPEFLALAEQALREDSPEKRLERSEKMKFESWKNKAELVRQRIEIVREKKRSRRTERSVATHQVSAR
jgi:glycosyltransferase involved in cell wall biosynthesis